MDQGGIDVRTGEIWLVESTAPIRPLMALPEFMQTFAPLGVARIDMAMNPFPQCAFGRTVCIADQHFSVQAQFSKKTSTSTPGCEVRVSSPWGQLNEEPSTRIPDLRFLRLLARRSAWKRPAGKRKQSRLLLAVRRLFSSKSLAINLRQGYESMEEERVVYESWLSRP